VNINELQRPPPNPLVFFSYRPALIAVVAQVHHAGRLRFQDLMHYSYSIARVRCMHP